MKARGFDSCINGDWYCFTLCVEGVHLTVADYYDDSKDKITVHRRVILDGKCDCSDDRQCWEMELDQGIIDLIDKFHATGVTGEEWIDEFNR